MKVLLFLVAVFPLAVAGISYKPDIDYWNNLRRPFAKMNNIPNMWKLVEDASLAEIASKLPKDCSKLQPSANWRYYMFHGDAAVTKFEKDLVIWFDKTEKTDPAAVRAKQAELEKTTGFFIETMNPVQNRIGCAQYACTKTVDGVTLTYQSICLLGPSGKFGIQFPLDPSAGKPAGSDCGSGKNDDGLCVN